MKKNVFTLLTLVALVVMAGSAMAQTNTTVTQGGTYSYTLTGIVVNTAGEVTIDFNGDAAEVVTIASGFASSTPTAPAGSYDAVFTVKYSDAAINGNLVVIVTDGAGCSNQIFLPITVLAEPTIDLAVTTSQTTDYCQTTTGTTANVAASVGSTNSFTFTVTPTVTYAPTNYTWGYTIGIPDPTLTGYVVKKGASTVTLPLVVSGIASTVTSEVYTFEFTTTTGAAPKNVVATVSAAALTETSGGGVYNEDVLVLGDNVKTVVVKSTPSIGSFN